MKSNVIQVQSCLLGRLARFKEQKIEAPEPIEVVETQFLKKLQELGYLEDEARLMLQSKQASH